MLLEGFCLREIAGVLLVLKNENSFLPAMHFFDQVVWFYPKER